MHHPTTTTKRRRFAFAGVAASALALVVSVGAGPASATTSDAATWIAGQLTSPATGQAYLGGSGTPDVGLSSDGVFAFAASGTVTDVANEGKLLTWLNKSTNSGAYFRSGTDYYPGAMSKLALAAYAGIKDGLSFNPLSFAGVNLLTRTEATQAISGKYVDARGYDNPTTQALAIIALTRGAKPTTLAAAATYLEASVCSDGTYPGWWGGCGLSAQPSPAGDLDTTAVAAVALDYYGATYSDATATAAASTAYTKLAGFAQTTGTQSAWQNYCQSPWTSLDASANSTGLAVAALSHNGTFSSLVTQGKNWLLAAQGTGTSLGSLPACTNAGAGDVRATVQGILGLAGLSYVDLI
jgi:hypothetical protein